jgi:hypothetical protein
MNRTRGMTRVGGMIGRAAGAFPATAGGAIAIAAVTPKAITTKTIKT